MRITNHRQRLLDAALECLSEKGYARTTARDLVAASGTNLASIGYHFGSKEALLDEAIETAFDRWAEEALRIVLADPDAGPQELVARGMAETLEAFKRNRPLLVAFLEALAQTERSAELRRRFAAWYERSRQQLGALIESRFPPDTVDGRSAASLLLAVGDGLLVQWLLDPKRAPTPDEVERTLTLVAGAALGR